MSWQWCVRFAREKGVSVIVLSKRKQLLPYHEFINALRSCAEQPRELTEDERVNQLLGTVGLQLSPQRELTRQERLEKLSAELGWVKVK